MPVIVFKYLVKHKRFDVDYQWQESRFRYLLPKLLAYKRNKIQTDLDKNGAALTKVQVWIFHFDLQCLD